MKNKPIKSADIRSLNILHKAMLTGQILFSILAFYLIYSDSFKSELKLLDKTFQVIAILFCAAGVGVGSIFFKNKLLKINKSDTVLQRRFAEYRTASIIQWACIEAPCLFSIISFLLTGNYAFLALAIFMIIYFSMLAPSKAKIAMQLKINVEEITSP